MILILEDSHDRIQRFERVIRALDPAMPFRVWQDALSMVREVGDHIAAAHLISLDHDLIPLPDGSDPGDGLDVAKFLAAQPIIRPVIVHTSNGERGRMMMGELQYAGWVCERIAPFGDDWIEREWAGVVRRILGA
jgi:hypothetical protein